MLKVDSEDTTGAADIIEEKFKESKIYDAPVQLNATPHFPRSTVPFTRVSVLNEVTIQEPLSQAAYSKRGRELP